MDFFTFDGKLYSEESLNLYEINYRFKKNVLTVRHSNNRYYKATSKTGQAVINDATANNPDFLYDATTNPTKNGFIIKSDTDEGYEEAVSKADFNRPNTKVFIIIDAVVATRGKKKPPTTASTKFTSSPNNARTDILVAIAGKDYSIDRIINFIAVEFHPTNLDNIPPMAHGEINCVLNQIFLQSHYKKVLKEDIPKFATIEDIIKLEDKFKINVIISDEFDRIWRTPDKRHLKTHKRHPRDVFITCKNYHASKANPAVIRPQIDIELPSVKTKKESNASVTRFHTSASEFKNKYRTLQELTNKHFSLLDSKIKHFAVDNGKHIIGLVVPSEKTNYKNSKLEELTFIEPTDWSISGAGRRMLQKNLTEMGEEYCTQIPNHIVYQNIKNSQTPVMHIFNNKAKGTIIQIDGNRAYTNAALGNLPNNAKPFYMGYPTAPRNILTVNKKLTKSLFAKLSTLGLGFALIDFDQTHLPIKTLFTGRPVDKATTTVSLPALFYMLVQKVKITVNQYYYSKTAYTDNPFRETFLDIRELEDDSKSSQKSILKMLPNRIVGLINKSNAKSEVFATVCPEEMSRFLAEDHNVTRWTTKEIKTELTKDLGEIKTAFHKEYVIYHRPDQLVDSFNMTHLSKYVTDYQKIVLHAEAKEKTNNDPKNLLAINTDSITYLSKTASPIDLKFWKIEAEGTDFIAKSNGCKCVINDDKLVYSRHGGSKDKWTVANYKSMALTPVKTLFHQKEFTTAVDFNTASEDVPLPNQQLRTIFAGAGYGKTELSKFIAGKKSKFVNTDQVTYSPDEILSVATTHVARKLIQGEYTLQGVLARLKRSPALLENIKALLIDEISMASMQHLERLDRLLRTHLINKPFGGLDVYLVGHMKQLPQPDSTAKPITDSRLFALFTPIELTTNYRHNTDPAYAEILTKIEQYYDIGGDEKSLQQAKNVLPVILSKSQLALLRTRVTPKQQIHDLINGGEPIIPLHHKNNMVASSNKLLGSLTVGNECIIRFNKKFKTKGIASDFNNGDKHVIQDTTPKAIKLGDRWFPNDYFVKQPSEKFPRIQLSKSMTIHCSQGQTLSKIAVYAKSLSMNLLYVALSRVRTLDDLYLYNM